MSDFSVDVIGADGPALTGLGAYYLTDFPQAANEVYGPAVELLGVRSGGELRAVFPLLCDGRKAILPPLAQYWGVWPIPLKSPAPGRDESLWEKTVFAIDAYLRKRGLTEAAFIHPPLVTDARPFLRLGWEVTPRYTYLVPPEGEDSWDSATRRQLKKSRERGIEVKQTESWENIYRMHREGMSRQGLPHAPESLVRALANRGTILETATAAVLFGRDQTAGYYVLAASDPEGHGDGSPTALVAAVLDALRVNGLSLDFVGANTPKLCRFKRGFGGRLVPYFQTRLVIGKTRRFLTGLKRAFRGA